jgi:cell volume regulation protein A
MIGVEYLLLAASTLILLSIAIARLSDNLGVPTLILFLGLGMLAGSEGPGGIFFDDAGLAQSIGVIALTFILFAGGLDTNWNFVRPVLWPAVRLSTVGVVLTAASVGLFAHFVLGFPVLHGLLLGAVISSTDAAAVFSVLRSRNVSLKGKLKPLLELESGSNDPMAVFLTIGLIQLITSLNSSYGEIVLMFIYQMGIGGILGVVLGKLMVVLLNRLRSSYEGLYPVFAVAFAAFVYGLTAATGGSGFLAVYVSGIIIGNSDFVQKKSLLRFFDGLAWLSQISMFVTLGVFVYPSELVQVAVSGLLVSGFLMFIARPVGVYFSLMGKAFSWREKTLVSWVGLRGAVPIILATFPLLASVEKADVMFNIVFFAVLTSALLQGSSIPFVARLLGVDAPLERKRRYPIEFAPTEGSNAELVDFIVPFKSAMIGKSIVEMGLPPDSLFVLVSRDDKFIVPSGGTTLEEGDTVLALVTKENLPTVRAIFSEQREEDQPDMETRDEP